MFDKLGNMPVGQPQQIVNHQNLAVAGWPGPDADRGNLEPLGNGFRDIGGDAFQHHGKSAGSLDLEGIGQKPVFVPLNPVSAHLMNRLGGQADMGLNGNAGQGYGLDDPAHRSPPSSLTAAAPPSLMNRPALATAVSMPV